MRKAKKEFDAVATMREIRDRLAGTDLCQPPERNDAEPLHGLLRNAFRVLPSFVHREVEAAYRLALRREFQLWCRAQKPNENNFVHTLRHAVSPSHILKFLMLGGTSSTAEARQKQFL